LPPLERFCCPVCLHGECGKLAGLALAAEAAVCSSCGARYPLRDGVLDLRYPPAAAGDVADLHRDFYEAQYSQGEYGAREGQEEHIAALARWLATIARDAFVLELGTGRGALQALHPGYVGADLSVASLKRWIAAPCFAADAQALPLRPSSVDFLYTVAVLEHVPRPERALREVERVLAPGGIAYLAPAWHCRPWAADGINVRPWSDLSWGQRGVKASLPLRDSLAWRAAFALPVRAARRLAWSLRRRPTPYRYRPLRANFEVFWASDSDATASLDPHETALFFESRGWRVLAPQGGWRSVLHRAQALVVRKGDGVAQA
jgi:SAM-dependent methyltransferase